MTADRAFTAFQELGSALHWDEEQLVLMLWVYLDESGVHDKKTGKEIALILGGCLAHYRDWLCFERDWQAALKDEGIDWFHMVDFESPDADVSYS